MKTEHSDTEKLWSDSKCSEALIKITDIKLFNEYSNIKLDTVLTVRTQLICTFLLHAWKKNIVVFKLLEFLKYTSEWSIFS